MKYVRIVVAVEDDRLEDLDNYLTCFLETDEIPEDFVVDPKSTSNPIQGSYSSTPYDDRDEAIRGQWIDATTTDSSPDTLALAEFIVDSEVDHPEIVEHLVPFMTKAAIVDLCERLELCPIHHCDAAICADDGVVECEVARTGEMNT